MQEQTPKNSPSALSSAVHWAAVAFVCAALVGGLAISVCTRHACVGGGPAWLGSMVNGYLWLSSPWLLVYYLASFGRLPPSFPVVISTGAAVTVALGVFVARYTLVRFRAFLQAPLHEAAPAAGEHDDPRVPPPAPWLTLLAIAFVLTLVLIAILRKREFTLPALQGFGTVALLVAALASIPVYFEFRRSQRTNKLEIALAFAWIALRRTLASIVSLLFILFAAASFRGGSAGVGVCSLVFGAVIAWLGWFGAGYGRSFADDIPTHRARKRRYGWK